MLNIDCTFVDELPTDSIGFDLGNMEFRGAIGVVTSASRSPDQSMMLVLSIVLLLDGIRHFLLQPKNKEYKFTGADCSFTIVFKKVGNDQISIFGDAGLIDTVTSTQLKKDIENSVAQFVREYDLDKRMNEAEASDIWNSLKKFQSFID